MSTYDPIHEGIQSWLNQEGEGWMVKDYVAVVGAVRVDSDGNLEHRPFLFYQPDQPPWVTDALIMKGEELKEYEDVVWEDVDTDPDDDGKA